jgi:hypothetical protein
VIIEYGTAYLFGRSLAERAVALIEIEHPDDRRELLEASIEQGLLPRDQQLPSRAPYPVAEERETRLRDWAEVRIRPTRTGDSKAMQELFYRRAQRIDAEGGNRTHTGREPHWILSPARLPVPPLRRETKSSFVAVKVSPARRDRVLAEPQIGSRTGRRGLTGNHGFPRAIPRALLS